MRKHLTYANVMATLAVAFTLGGGVAYAANTVFSEDIVDGEVKAADIANNAVRSTKIGNGQVLNQDLGADAVNSASVFDNSLTSEDLGSGSVGEAEILTDAVGATEIADGSIDGGEIIDESMSSDDLAPDSVHTSELGDDAVGTANVVGNSLTTADIANNSLTTADIKGTDVNGSISLAAGSVPNGRCEQFTSSNSGAEEDQGVIFATRGALQQGVMISAQRVPSDGNVTLNVCNFSGTTQAAITNLPVRVITFG